MELKKQYCEDEMPVGKLISLKNELRVVATDLWQTNNSIKNKLNTVCYFDIEKGVIDETKEPQTLLDEIQLILNDLRDLDRSLLKNYNHLSSIV